MRASQAPLDGLHIAGPHHTCHFLAVLQKNQCGPQLDAVAAPQRLARAVLDLEVRDVGAQCQRLFNQRLSAQAVAAPRRAKFQHRGAGQVVCLLACRGLGQVLGGVGH